MVSRYRVRVYHLPDFVDFSHKGDLTKAKATCETCHGPLRDRDVIRKEMDTSMAGCMDCHRANDASVACNDCPTLARNQAMERQVVITMDATGSGFGAAR